METRKNNISGVLGNLTLHLVWAALGAAYLVAMVVYDFTPFLPYAQLDNSPPWSEFIFLGKIIPIALFLISVWGVLSLLIIPMTCRYLTPGSANEDAYGSGATVYMILAGVLGVGIIFVIPMFFEADGIVIAFEFFQSLLMDTMGLQGGFLFIYLAIFLPFLAPFAILLINKYDSRFKGLIALGLLCACLLVIAIVVLCASSVKYLIHFRPDYAMFAPWLILLIPGFFVVGGGTVTGIIIFIKDR